jgi:hypothetical protein
MQPFLFLLIPVALLSLCLPFLSNPLLFDDFYFFIPGAPEKFFSDGIHLLSPRWWVYETMAATFVLAGSEIFWLRLGNLFAHVGTALALYVFIRRLLIDLDRQHTQGVSAETAALIAAAFFAFHPMAIFAQGYLIQRTIVCATLFSLLSWLAFWRGLSGSRSALWVSCLLFAIALYAKEHAVVVPAVSFCLLILYRRSGLKLAFALPELASALLLQAILAIVVVLQMKGVLGVPYETMTVEVLEGEADISQDMLYPLSVLNQCGLFFKYLLLWVLPNSSWMSIDIREAFPLDFAQWTLWGGACLYATYGIGSWLFLLRGGVAGLLGLALLVPWLLFATEFASVRFQEPFVLYRSYLWVPALFVVLALGVRRVSKGVLWILVPLFGVYLMALSYGRLSTFAHSYLVWNEAALHSEKTGDKQGVFGAYRIYFNRGNALHQLGMLEAALADYARVLQLKPNYAHAFHQRGVVYLDLKQWSKAQGNFAQAIALMPNNTKSYLGYAKTLEFLGNHQEARKTLQFACALGSSVACEGASN